MWKDSAFRGTIYPYFISVALTDAIRLIMYTKLTFIPEILGSAAENLSVLFGSFAYLWLTVRFVLLRTIFGKKTLLAAILFTAYPRPNDFHRCRYKLWTNFTNRNFFIYSWASRVRRLTRWSNQFVRKNFCNDARRVAVASAVQRPDL